MSHPRCVRVSRSPSSTYSVEDELSCLRKAVRLPLCRHSAPKLAFRQRPKILHIVLVRHDEQLDVEDDGLEVAVSFIVIVVVVHKVQHRLENRRVVFVERDHIAECFL
jgi:hypothetical protein